MERAVTNWRRRLGNHHTGSRQPATGNPQAATHSRAATFRARLSSMTIDNISTVDRVETYALL